MKFDRSLDYFRHRLDENWIWGIDGDRCRSIVERRSEQLQHKIKRTSHLKVLISESDPAHFLGSFIAATSSNCSVFLANPNWVECEWQQVLDLIHPDVVWGREVSKNLIDRSNSSYEVKNCYGSTIAIATGGTSGNIRFALHTWETLITSVVGFIEYFQIETINSCCTLPLYHVSGLMQFLRSLITGGKLWLLPSKKLELAADRVLPATTSQWFISLVPTQLQRILQNPELTQWLSRFQTVLLGGAPAWTELLELAREKRIRLAPTYGMTETASQVATLKPDDFLAGNNSCGRVLPHAKIKIKSPISTHPHTTGIIHIQTPSLAFGYYPQLPENTQPVGLKNKRGEMMTDDVGFFDDRGYLYIVGRCSDKIITGGENVFPAEVESAIRASELVADICAIGIPHKIWGQAVVAVYVPHNSQVTAERLSRTLGQKLAKFKHPKHWIAVESLPRNDRGKVNRSAVLEIVRSRLPVDPEKTAKAKV
ncbi:MAG: 2-succinylbenzoate--CoA ligase [Geitlerinemataceae cyanobacterium]